MIFMKELIYWLFSFIGWVRMCCCLPPLPRNCFYFFIYFLSWLVHKRRHMPCSRSDFCGLDFIADIGKFLWYFCLLLNTAFETFFEARRRRKCFYTDLPTCYLGSVLEAEVARDGSGLAPTHARPCGVFFVAEAHVLLMAIKSPFGCELWNSGMGWRH